MEYESLLLVTVCDLALPVMAFNFCFNELCINSWFTLLLSCHPMNYEMISEPFSLYLHIVKYSTMLCKLFTIIAVYVYFLEKIILNNFISTLYMYFTNASDIIFSVDNVMVTHCLINMLNRRGYFQSLLWLINVVQAQHGQNLTPKLNEI